MWAAQPKPLVGLGRMNRFVSSQAAGAALLVVLAASCTAPTTSNSCADAVMNGTETDVDCGGAECGACPSGKHCTFARDCEAALDCRGGICANLLPPDDAGPSDSGPSDAGDAGSIDAGLDAGFDAGLDAGTLCDVNNGGCSLYASCAEASAGTATCTCGTGFSGNGITCTASNDNCSAAATLSPGVAVYGTTQTATTDFSCTGTNGADVIYSFVSPTTSAYSASLKTGLLPTGDGGVSFNARVAVVDSPCDGSCNHLTRSLFGTAGRVNFRMTAGVPRTVVVGPTGEPSTPSAQRGDFRLLVSPITPPPNDSCTSAQVLALNTSVSVDFSQALRDDPNGLCGSETPTYVDLFYTFTPQVSGRYRFASDGIERLGLGTTCGQACTKVTAGGALTEQLTAGVPVFLQVNASESKVKVLSVELLGPPPDNDTCTAPVALVLNAPVFGSTATAHNSFACSGAGPDVVYSFAVPADGVYSAAVATGKTASGDAGVAFAANVSVGDGPCDGGGCALRVPPLDRFNFRASAGSTKTIVVDGANEANFGDFQVVVKPIAPAGNDLCAAPLPLTLDVPVSVNLADAVFDLPTDNGCELPGGEFFYSFTPATSGPYTISAPGARVALLRGACDSSCFSALDDRLTLRLIGGTKYFVAVSDVRGSLHSLLVQKTIGPEPENDTCAAPTRLSPDVPVYGSTLFAKADLSCAAGPEVTYAFTPPTSSNYAAHVDVGLLPSGNGGVLFQSQLFIADGPCDGGCGAAGGAFDQNFHGTAGLTKTIIVGGLTGELAGDFRLTVHPVAAPSNDTCASPTGLALDTTVPVLLANAVPDSTDPSCSRNDDLYFFFTPSISGVYRFTAPATQLNLSTVCGKSCEASAYDRLTVPMVAGTTYFLQVAGYTDTTLSFERLTGSAPDNETCAAPTTFAQDVTVFGSTVFAKNDFSCSGNAGDVVYSFMPTATAAYSAVFGDGALPDGGVGVVNPNLNAMLYDGSCDSARCEQANRPMSHRVNFRASAGTPKVLIIDGNAASDIGDFSLRVSPIVPPSNDTCAAPIALALDVPVATNLTLAVKDSTQTSCVVYRRTLSDADLFYTFVPSVSGQYTFHASPSPSLGSTELGLATGACGQACFVAAPDTLSATLTAATTYSLQVSGPLGGTPVISVTKD